MTLNKQKLLTVLKELPHAPLKGIAAGDRIETELLDLYYEAINKCLEKK